MHDDRNYHSAARRLQIAIEACMDVGHHIISRKALRRPNYATHDEQLIE